MFCTQRSQRKVADLRVLVIIALLLMGSWEGASATTSMIGLSGHAWEDGDFPPSRPFDEIRAVGIVTRIQAPLFWSPDIFSYTWYAHGLISMGETVFGTTHLAEYVGGEFAIHVDTYPSNHDYGIFPGNATVPATFTDGHATYLVGYFES